MSKQVMRSFAVWFVIFGACIVTGTIAAIADTITGAVSWNESTQVPAYSGGSRLFLLEFLVEIDSSNAEVLNDGEITTISEVRQGDIARITGNLGDIGTIEASRIEIPAIIEEGYDGQIVGKTDEVDTKGDTFVVMGQRVDAGGLKNVEKECSSKKIGFNTMKDGVSVTVFVDIEDDRLVAKKMMINSESCTFCHGKKGGGNCKNEAGDIEDNDVNGAMDNGENENYRDDKDDSSDGGSGNSDGDEDMNSEEDNSNDDFDTSTGRESDNYNNDDRGI
ncbi:MAG: hypothetical protein MRJ65_06415 [Candidatus Brocadiaceae bacterium]|nr:hypothetical protein [Candidatus Brocadiaceae bacterium]